MTALRELADRLDVLVHAVTEARWSEFSMRVPAEPSRDADLVLSQAAIELRAYAAILDAERIKAGEGAVPVAWRDPTNADPGQAVTFDKGTAEKWPHKYPQALFPHPPAQAAQQAATHGASVSIGKQTLASHAMESLATTTDPAAQPTTNSPETGSKLVGGVVVRVHRGMDGQLYAMLLPKSKAREGMVLSEYRQPASQPAERAVEGWTGEIECCDAKGFWLVSADDCPFVPGQRVTITAAQQADR